ncbi:MAG: putative AAA+ superfamily ATPase [Myxococcota bacterium]|jgi:predicted AAA+ superfamily ATPase
MLRFWTMLAHQHGQVLNASALSRSFGVSDTTVRNYLDTLAHTFMVTVLLPGRRT